MKKNILFIIALFFVQISFSQPTEIDPNGYNVFYYKNGNKASEGFLKDNKPNGYWKTYHQDGKIKTEGNRKNFLLDSVWTFYNEMGDTTKKICYLQEKRNGYFVKYNTRDRGKKNTVASKEMYIDDKKQGKAYFFYDSEELHEVVTYKDNAKEGKAYEYNKEGIIITLNQYHHNNLVDRESINGVDKQGKKQGKWIEFYTLTNVKTSAYYKNGLLHGNYREFSKSGKLLVNQRYINGELFVEKKEDNNSKPGNVKSDIAKNVIVKNKYFDNGKLKSNGGYHEEIPVGVHRVYAKNGSVVSAITYSDLGIIIANGIVDTMGLKQGSWTCFYSTGEVLSEGNFKNNKKEGEWSFFFENGNIEQKGIYKKNKTEGLWQWYYETGELLRKEFFENGAESGKAYELTTGGDTICSGNYFAGEKQGKWYYCIGDELQKGEYSAGLRNGVWKHFYYPEMQLKYQGEFLRGAEQEIHKYYFPSGKLKEQGEFVAGRKDGNWRYYDADGLLKTTIAYRFGIIDKIDGVKIENNK